jgi:hypothetical protein
MNDSFHNPPDATTLMDELSFLQEKMETAVKERQEMYNELQRETARMQAALDGIYQSKSWRWTTPLRKLESILRRNGKKYVPYGLLGHVKKLWVEIGSPCPRVIRFVRHRILGKIWHLRVEK